MIVPVHTVMALCDVFEKAQALTENDIEDVSRIDELDDLREQWQTLAECVEENADKIESFIASEGGE